MKRLLLVYLLTSVLVVFSVQAKKPDKTLKIKNVNVTEESVNIPFFGNFQIIFGLNGGGPLLFKDTADTKLQNTTLFMYGGKFEFLFGHYKKHNHRFGLGISYDLIAKSEDRDLNYLKTYLVYQTGFPFNMEFHIGGNIAMGSPDFAENYTGLYTGATLKYMFINENSDSQIAASLGITGQYILTPNDMQYNNAFVGLVLEFVFKTDN